MASLPLTQDGLGPSEPSVGSAGKQAQELGLVLANGVRYRRRESARRCPTLEAVPLNFELDASGSGYGEELGESQKSTSSSALVDGCASAGRARNSPASTWVDSASTV
jgi:hypothetical protein